MADGISRLSVSSGGQHDNLPNGNAIVPVGEVRTALPAPNLEGIKQVETHTRALGVIQPPPDLKAIVDKTASYVAKNGESHSFSCLNVGLSCSLQQAFGCSCCL